jgi:hypothetical protein
MPESPAPPPPARDAWDKADIILKPVGGLLTALAVAILGLWTSSYLREREGREAALRERMQTTDTNARLYSELISKREEAESSLRKDMFTSIINSFLGKGPASLEQKVLNLELLVYNFHESLNLKPLFLHLARDIKKSPQRSEYLARLNRVAEEVAKKQMLVIEEGGTTFDATLNLNSESFLAPDGETEVPFVERDLVVDGVERNFRLQILQVDQKNEQIQLRVTVRTGQPESAETTSTEFWFDRFDFPMIDNTRLSQDQRLAVVLNNFDVARGVADVTAAYFPGKYSGLREKPYYDEILAQLLAENRRATTGTGSPGPARP